MTRESQRERELRLIKQLLRHVPEWTDLPLVQLEEDPPDFRLGEALGVEVTEFHRTREHAAPQVAIEKAREQVTLAARRLYEASAGKPLYVHVYFRDGPLPMAQSDELAMVIAQAVREDADRASPKHKIEPDGLPPLARSCVRWISMFDNGSAAEWECLSGGSVEGGWGEIEELILKKEADLTRWPPWATERWLLIAAPGTEDVGDTSALVFSSMFPQLARLPQAEIASQFDGVHVLDVITDTVRRVV